MSLLAPGDDFASIVRLIEDSRQRAYAAVNTALIELYWQIGETLSRKIAGAEWGEGVIARLAEHIAATYPGLRGFTARNLFRTRQFYETYRDDELVTPLVTQLPWTHHLIIMGQSQRPEEREFYIRQAVSERWSKRELERQAKSALFERSVLHTPKVSPLVRQLYPDALTAFKDAYMVEFLGLPDSHQEADLHLGLVARLKAFLVELGGISVLSGPNIRSRSTAAISRLICCSSIAV